MFLPPKLSHDGLEKSEAEDMITAIQDIQKSTKDIEIRQNRGQSFDRASERLKEAEDQLFNLLHSWFRRPYRKPRDDKVPLMTVNELSVNKDPQAVFAMRRLYDWLDSHNTSKLNEEVWNSNLMKLTDEFVSLLKHSTVLSPITKDSKDAYWRPGPENQMHSEKPTHHQSQPTRLGPSEDVTDGPTKGGTDFDPHYVAGQGQWVAHPGIEGHEIVKVVMREAYGMEYKWNTS